MKRKKSLTATIFVTTLIVGLLVYLICTSIFAFQLYNYIGGTNGCAQHSLAAFMATMWQEFTLMLLATVLISLVVATFISKIITKTFYNIDLDNPEHSNVYSELKPFTKRIAEENFEKNQREALRQQFTANVSHELKTPLTSISGFAEILKAGKVDNKTVVDFSSSIYDESQRMITLVNDIIKLSKLDEQSISQEKELISLRDITKEVLETVQAAGKKKHITFVLTGDSGNISGVYSVIYEMIFNLCDNGIKYNKDGGQVFIKINTDLQGNKVSISVGDTGIGFDNKERDRIFERFYRIDKSRSKELGGTGLGLSIVKHGAKYHNADLFVESQVGQGSVFTVTFPRNINNLQKSNS